MYAALARLLRLGSVVASFVLIASFGMFASDQLGGASRQQQAEIASGTWTPPPTAAAHHSGLRGTIDRADAKLKSPFSGLVATSHSLWLTNGIETLVALVLFGFGLGWLARVIRIHA